MYVNKQRTYSLDSRFHGNDNEERSGNDKMRREMEMTK